MFRVRNNTIPEAFWTKFRILQHNYTTRQSKNIFEEPKITLKVQSLQYPHVDLVSGINILTGL